MYARNKILNLVDSRNKEFGIDILSNIMIHLLNNGNVELEKPYIDKYVEGLENLSISTCQEAVKSLIVSRYTQDKYDMPVFVEYSLIRAASEYISNEYIIKPSYATYIKSVYDNILHNKPQYTFDFINIDVMYQSRNYSGESNITSDRLVSLYLFDIHGEAVSHFNKDGNTVSNRLDIGGCTYPDILEFIHKEVEPSMRHTISWTRCNDMYKVVIMVRDVDNKDKYSMFEMVCSLVHKDFVMSLKPIYSYRDGYIRSGMIAAAR